MSVTMRAILFDVKFFFIASSMCLCPCFMTLWATVSLLREGLPLSEGSDVARTLASVRAMENQWVDGYT